MEPPRPAIDPRDELGQAFDAQVVPTLFLLDRNGELRFSHAGFAQGDEDEITRSVERLLTEGLR